MLWPRACKTALMAWCRMDGSDIAVFKSFASLSGISCNISRTRHLTGRRVFSVLMLSSNPISQTDGLVLIITTSTPTA